MPHCLGMCVPTDEYKSTKQFTNIGEIMNKYLYVETKTVYGNELVYPKCERSQVLAKLCGTKTFTEKHIRLILKLGYEFHPWMDGLKSKLEWKVLEAKVKADDNPYKHLIQ